MRKMTTLMIVLAVWSVLSISAFAQMGTGHGNGMMDGGWGWGMNSGWFLVIIIAILAIVGIVYIIKRK
jgi:Spy/CpxP family protein refolding chaperone